MCIADAVGAHDFTLRELLILDFIRRQSFGAGRDEAYVPELDLFATATRISRGNVSSTLKRLKFSLVIEERPQWFYGFRFPIMDWKVPVRLDQVEVIRQLALFEAPEHLRDALRETFIEQCATGKPGWEPGLSSASPRQGAAPIPPVPESGTGPMLGDRSRIGNGPQTPVKSGVCRGVPESGTALAILQQCRIAPERSQSCNAAIEGVPESGTPGGQGGGAFDDYQQELFDQLVAVGAFTKRRDDPSRPFWYGMVRKRPAVVEELLGELKWARQKGLRISHPGKFMNNKWHLWGKPDK